MDCLPVDFYCLFFDEEILDFLIIETNRYASQSLRNRRLKAYFRLKKWTPIDRTVMRNFLGLVMWMGLVNMHSLVDYWRKDILYANKITEVMSRNRFELILSIFHCSNNEKPEHGRLDKIQKLVDLLVFNFQKWYVPEEVLCINESVTYSNYL